MNPFTMERGEAERRAVVCETFHVGKAVEEGGMLESNAERPQVGRIRVEEKTLEG